MSLSLRLTFTDFLHMYNVQSDSRIAIHVKTKILHRKSPHDSYHLRKD
jgi:hypothetical protein